MIDYRFTNVLRLLLLLLLSAPLLYAPALAATCKPTGICNACKNCKYCKHCSKEGGSCSKCRKRAADRSPAPDVFLQKTSTTAKPTRPHRATTAKLQGKVIGITDGDTMTLLTGSERVTVSLYGIDCPEVGQPFSDAAKQFTSESVLDKPVTVFIKRGVHSRQVQGWLFIGRTCVNRELIVNGLAWWHQAAAPDEHKLDDLEQQARAAKRGLWSEENPIAPWEWRRAYQPVQAPL